jgi:hypothetical protein
MRNGPLPFAPPEICPELSRYTTLIFGFNIPTITHEKYIKDGKVLAQLGFKSKVLLGSLTDLNAWVGFCTSSPQQGVKYQH